MRLGNPGDYKYIFSENEEEEGRLVTYVGYFSAIRYCNWLQNQHGGLEQDSENTEHGIDEWG